jgi:hypothetical protein
VATGTVRVKFTDPEPLEIDGRLIDVSTHGFRMAHVCQSLHSGQVVEFTHVEAAGNAQVMWNRILAGGVETGFRIVTN